MQLLERIFPEICKKFEVGIHLKAGIYTIQYHIDF